MGHRARSYQLDSRSRGVVHAADTDGEFIIPHVVELMRTCKTLTHTLLSRCIGDSGRKGEQLLVTGSLDEILAASDPIKHKSDQLTEAMYPPMAIDRVVTLATALVHAIDGLVSTAKRNCTEQGLAWIDPQCATVLGVFKTLCMRVDRLRELQNLETEVAE